MADYTVVVDDSNSQIIYGPDGESWSFDSALAYQGTLHTTVSRDPSLTFSFIGGREVIILGYFVGDNNASDITTYPIFQVDAENLTCGQNPPRNGGQFVCFISSLSSEVTNRTLTMFVNPNVAIQPFQIDFIRYGTSSEVAQTMDATVLYVKVPDNTTPGLSLEGDWKYQSVGGINDILRAMQTSTPTSKAAYSFIGDYVSWWSCCMPPGTPSDTANVTYSIDGGDDVLIQIGGELIQDARCKDENLLFQTQPGQLQAGNHTVEVVYHGDDTKMPLTLCGLAATPVDFSTLDVHPSNSGPPPSATISPSVTSSSTPSSSTTPSFPSGGSSDHGEGPTQKSHTGMIVGVICGVAFISVLLFAGIIWWRKRAKQRAQTMGSSSILPFAFHPDFGYTDAEKRTSSVVPSLPASAKVRSDIPIVPPIRNDQEAHNGSHSTETHSSSSQLELRPPSYHSASSLLNS